MRKTYYLKDHPYPMQSAIYGKITQPIDREIYLLYLQERLAVILEATHPQIRSDMLRYLRESESTLWIGSGSAMEQAEQIIYGSSAMEDRVLSGIPRLIEPQMMVEKDPPDNLAPKRQDVSHLENFICALICK
jgi:hypothetical protein